MLALYRGCIGLRRTDRRIKQLRNTDCPNKPPAARRSYPPKASGNPMKRIISALLIGVAPWFPGSGAAAPIRLADDAPDSHVVVTGDTLWGISGKFLKEPWRWPEVWRPQPRADPQSAPDLPGPDLSSSTAAARGLQPARRTLRAGIRVPHLRTPVLCPDHEQLAARCGRRSGAYALTRCRRIPTLPPGCG
jgi:hypothetical protein